jgi:hypothetical protein
MNIVCKKARCRSLGVPPKVMSCGGPLVHEIVKRLSQRLAYVLPIELVEIAFAAPPHTHAPDPVRTPSDVCSRSQRSACMRVYAGDPDREAVSA